MEGAEFRQKRERLGLTQVQVAQRLNISTATVRNWESGVTPITTAVEMLWEVWEPRFRQEDPKLGPVTLIYTDAPMWVDPQGPRRPLAMMQQEPFLTNAAAIARACILAGRNGFNGPLIMLQSGDILWNAVQLARVIDKSDTGAPTVANMLRAIATDVRENSAVYVRTGPRLPTADEVLAKQAEIGAQADQLDALADADQPTDKNSLPAEAVCAKLRELGVWPLDHLVSGLAAAYVTRERYAAS